jgi:hypothetical protein
MGVVNILGFVLFAAGSLLNYALVLQVASFLLIPAALLYNWNVIEILTHKPFLK